MKRINAFEQWCYRRMLKISWKDKVPNAEVLRRVGEKEKQQQFFRKIVQQKLAYAGHVLRWSSGRNALVILEGKIRGKRAKGRPRRMWFDDVRQWTMLKDYTAGLPQSTLSPLQRVQNAAAWLVLDLRPYDHTTTALHRLHWLPVFFRVQYKLCILMQAIANDKVPALFHRVKQ